MLPPARGFLFGAFLQNDERDLIIEIMDGLILPPLAVLGNEGQFLIVLKDVEPIFNLLRHLMGDRTRLGLMMLVMQKFDMLKFIID